MSIKQDMVDLGTGIAMGTAGAVLGLNPVTAACLLGLATAKGAISFAFAVGKETIILDKKEIIKEKDREYEELHWVDPITNIRWDLDKKPSKKDKVELSSRLVKGEDPGKILVDLGLIKI